MATAQLSQEQYLLLDNIRWETYESLLKEVDDRHLRLTYDEGSLEITTLSLGHEKYGWLIGRMIAILTLELDIPIVGGGSTTLKRALKKKGLESDECFWILHEADMRDKTEFDFETDPPPDLAVEVDVTHSSLNRLAIYAALKVPEVWRWDGIEILVYVLASTGKYRVRKRSVAFPFLPMDEFLRFLKQGGEVSETALMCSFTRWARADLLPVFEARQSTSNERNRGTSAQE